MEQSATDVESLKADSAAVSAADQLPSKAALNMPALAPTPCEADAKAATPVEATRRAGAPRGNANRVTSGLRLSGSKLAAGCGGVATHVRTIVTATVEAWQAKHGDGPMPLAAEVLLKQIRRAEERDRLAAKQLKDGADLKGNPLSFDQQERLQAAQEAAGKLIEACLRKLGLGIDQQAATIDPWAAIDRDRSKP